MELTPRQSRELAYHAGHSGKFQSANRRSTHEVISRRKRKWWNYYWAAYSILSSAGLQGRSVLVPGCGTGLDAIRCAKLGAAVCAFDLSPDMLRLAGEAATAEGVRIDFQCMPAEQLAYPDSVFDVIFVRDLLHHCEVDQCVAEIARVAKPGAVVVVDELYTHNRLQGLRNSALGRSLYSVVRRYIYHGDDPYITEDEKKINEVELDTIMAALQSVQCTYFNIVVNRFLPDWDSAEILDRFFVKMAGPVAHLLAGRVLLTGRIK